MKYTHLTMKERLEIGNFLRQHFSIGRIAEITGQSTSMISREINRNGLGG